MTTYRKEGKDVIIFATAEDHKEPSKVVLPEPEPQAGLILPNGEINWNCPCLGGMASGPCGIEFREAFSCFHKSEADPKGGDCYEAFKKMHLCMAEYPALYNKYDDKDADLDFEEEGNPQVKDSDKKAESQVNASLTGSPAVDRKEGTGVNESSSAETAKQIHKNINT